MNKDLQKQVKKIQKSKIKKIKPKKEISKKKKIWNIVFYTTCGVVIAGSASYLIYYFVSGNTNNSWDGASEYISERSLALQFIFQDSTNSSLRNYVGGTGWIINKDSNSDTYYIATNLHVASVLTYQNKNIYSYEKGTSDEYGTIVQCLVGYVNSDVGKNSSSNYTSTNMITVPTPTIAYEAFNDFTSYPKIDGTSPTSYNGSNHASYSPSADFAILKYDFSNLVNNSSLNYQNSSTDVSNFENWLKNGYDAEPTKFLDKPIQDVNKWQDLRYSMGGFPGNGQSDALAANNNYLEQSWESFSNFTLRNSETTGYGNAGDVYSDASKGTYTDPIVWVNDDSDPSWTNSAGQPIYFSGYVNIAYEAVLNQYSRNGASGSMLITYLDNTPYVVGIYWGTTTFNDSNNTSLELGTADFFNTNTNGSYNSTNFSGYNLIQSSYTYILNSDKNLFFDPTKNQSR